MDKIRSQGVVPGARARTQYVMLLTLDLTCFTHENSSARSVTILADIQYPAKIRTGEQIRCVDVSLVC